MEVLLVFVAMLIAYIAGHMGGYRMGQRDSFYHMEYFIHGSSDFPTANVLEKIGTIAPYEEMR